MNVGQIQVRLSLTEQLYQFLLGQSSRLGIPVTQVIKYMVIEKAQQEKYPTFAASPATIKTAEKALMDYSNGNYVAVNNVDEFFEKL